MNEAVVALVPAFRPGPRLLRTVAELARDPRLAQVVVVDDGSGEAFAEPFQAVSRMERVRVLRHAVNLGKGAALKTGINHIACEFPRAAGIVTADADGQHSPADIAAVADELKANPASLVLGVRTFGPDVPRRSRLGNILTRKILKAVAGLGVSDTQTGLRGLPLAFAVGLLTVAANGYEFELDMLLAAKAEGRPIREVPIRTIYLDGNAGSHFDPVFDSMKIYFVLLRFLASSLLAALVDNLVFISIFAMGGGIVAGQLGGRAASAMVNYPLNKYGVFRSRQADSVLLPRYLALVAFSGVLSYLTILLIDTGLGLSVPVSKILAESLIFSLNFVLQRDLVFSPGWPTTKAPPIAAQG